MSHNERYDINKSLVLFKQGKIDKNTLLEHCTIPLKDSIYRKMGTMREDWLQEAYIVALKCIDEYNPKVHKHSFVTHLYNRVQWRIMRYSWEDKLIRKPVHLFEKNIDRTSFSICTWEHKSKNNPTGRWNVLDLIGSDESIFDVENKVIVENMFKKLRGKQFEFINLYYFYGYSYQEIADKYNCSFQNVALTITSGLKRMSNVNTKPVFKKTRATKIPVEIINKILSSGKTAKELSAEFGIAVSTIYSLKSSNVVCI